MLGQLGTVWALVRAGANSRLEDSQGQTPADIAARFGFPEVARECREANTEKFKRERQIRRPDEDHSVKKKRTFEENSEDTLGEDLSENCRLPSQMSSVINNEQRGTRRPTANCARGIGE